MRFEVDSAQVVQASGSVQQTAQRITEEVSMMMRQLIDLQGSWQGQAATSFQEVITTWQGTQEQVHSSLEHIQHALATAGRQYADAESAATALFALGPGT